MLGARVDDAQSLRLHRSIASRPQNRCADEEQRWRPQAALASRIELGKGEKEALECRRC